MANIQQGNKRDRHRGGRRPPGLSQLGSRAVFTRSADRVNLESAPFEDDDDGVWTTGYRDMLSSVCMCARAFSTNTMVLIKAVLDSTFVLWFIIEL